MCWTIRMYQEEAEAEIVTIRNYLHEQIVLLISYKDRFSKQCQQYEVDPAANAENDRLEQFKLASFVTNITTMISCTTDILQMANSEDVAEQMIGKEALPGLQEYLNQLLSYFRSMKIQCDDLKELNRRFQDICSDSNPQRIC
jgi:hypothetical protein